MDKLRGKMARQQEIVQYMVESVELLGSVNPDMRQKVMQMPRANDEKLEVCYVYYRLWFVDTVCRPAEQVSERVLNLKESFCFFN